MSRFNRDPFNKNLLSRDPLSRDPFNHDPFNRAPLSRDPFSTAQLSMDPFNMNLLRRDLFNMDQFNKDNMNGSRPEVRKCTVIVNTTPGSSDVAKGTQVNKPKLKVRQLKAKENPPSGPIDANVSSNPTQVANETTKETNVSSTLPNAGNQTRKDTNVSRNPPEDGNALIKDNEQFLKNNRAALIQKVKNVVEITDDLKLISAEQRSKIQAVETDQDKMRLLLDNTTSKAAAKDLVDALLQHAKDVMDDLINAQ